MNDTSTVFFTPPRQTEANGKSRRAGFEIEFGNLAVSDIASRLRKKFGGELKEQNPFRFTIENSALGKLRIERDAELLHSTQYREFLQSLDISFDEGTLAREIEQGVDRLSRNLIPCEIVTEPLTFDLFPLLNELVDVLNELDAEGTQAALTNAFGTHINPSAPDLTATTLCGYLQAFLLLNEWIIADSDTDFSRRFLTRFIDPFPDKYCALVLAEDYAPSLDQLIDDYLTHNPTRNRSLDMLPMFSEIDESTVLSGIKESERSLIKKRPAFHYRLPDCRLGDKDWSIAAEWNRWWYVEVIADDKPLRQKLLALWQEEKNTMRLPFHNRWIETVTTFLKQEIPPPDTA